MLQGDSGGPLVTEVDGRWTVIGLTSWGYSCGKASAPAMFAKVSSFVYMLEHDDEGGEPAKGCFSYIRCFRF